MAIHDRIEIESIARIAIPDSRISASLRSVSLHVLDRDRPALGGRDQGGFEDALGLVGVVEVGDRHGRLLAAEHLEDVVGLVDEAVLVADDVGVGPPVGRRRDGRRRGCT